VLVAADRVSMALGAGSIRTKVIDDATFELRGGEHVSIAGPSGSGKSTILHLVAGITPPTTGAISWPALGPASSLRPSQVSISFQGPSLMAPLSLLENVELPLLLSGVREAQARDEAVAMLERVGLLEVVERLPEELSGGQVQRGGVARALVGRPKLIVADEPTGQSDHVTAARVVDLLLEVASSLGSGLLIATHDRTVAARMDRHWTVHDRVLKSEMP
jgi:putative ABC transport system ATP-binding protein/lipoprotein-releasing system ATP-binding protein